MPNLSDDAILKSLNLLAKAFFNGRKGGVRDISGDLVLLSLTGKENVLRIMELELDLYKKIVEQMLQRPNSPSNIKLVKDFATYLEGLIGKIRGEPLKSEAGEMKKADDPMLSANLAIVERVIKFYEQGKPIDARELESALVSQGKMAADAISEALKRKAYGKNSHLLSELLKRAQQRQASLEKMDGMSGVKNAQVLKQIFLAYPKFNLRVHYSLEVKSTYIPNNIKLNLN